MKFSSLLLTAFVLHTGTTNDCVLINGTADCHNQNLTGIPQDLPIYIESLDLSENNLGNISNKSFARYSHLKTLELQNSKIHTVQPEGFDGLTSLENVSLAGNALNISTDGLFILKNIRNIINLDFSSNMNSPNKERYLFYPDEAFQQLTKLRNLSIDLYGHPIFGPGFKYLKLHSIRFKSCSIKALQNKTFVNLPDSVTELYLTECKFIENKAIEINVLFPFSKLSILSFSGTTISLTKGLELLYPFRNKSLEILDLSHMVTAPIYDKQSPIPDAIILTAGTTQYLKTICVKTLALADNNIVDILPYSFFDLDWKHLSCLEHIDLSGNRFGFSTLGLQMRKASPKLSNLKIFDFSYIPLRYKSANYLPVINDFKANQFRFKREDESCSDAAHSILTLNVPIPPRLEFVRITHVLGAPPLIKLNLQNTASLRHIDMSYYDVKCFPVISINETENNLEYLDISGIDCKLYYKNIPFFRALETLIMREAHVYRAVEENLNLFIYSPNLVKLDLSSNNLFTIPSSFLKHLKSLAILRLLHNYLNNIPSVIADLRNLGFLDLTGNRIFTVFPNFTSWFDSQGTKNTTFHLQLHGNDFSCSCEHQDFIRWLNTTKITLDNVKSYKCRLANGSITTTQVVLQNFHSLFSNCYATTWLHIGISIIISAFIIILPTAVIFNFRWRIIFFCYRKFRRIVENNMNLSYEYDVFVSYGYNGYTWVQATLIDKLETDWRLNVCLEDRNFVGGKSIYEQIAHAISSSRHIIFVVTSDFMSKPFAAYEIDQSKEAKSCRTLQKVIIVALDICIEDIPTDLRSIWSDVSVIELSQNNSDDQLSLDNLRTRLLLNF
ncbi:toll-like receptor 4 [Mytilus californianus]|uniref:toll-like receptor 4 n=1 Tax=Mytilus californianus TaxID=6549 RepID=UPI0022459E0F|nr:toll-like receptor 4 [Mytilus californianus]